MLYIVPKIKVPWKHGTTIEYLIKANYNCNNNNNSNMRLIWLPLHLATGLTDTQRCTKGGREGHDVEEARGFSLSQGNLGWRMGKERGTELRRRRRGRRVTVDLAGCPRCWAGAGCCLERGWERRELAAGFLSHPSESWKCSRSFRDP